MSRFNLKVRNQYLLSSSELSLISAVFCIVFVYRNKKITFTKFQNESLLKDIGQELLIVNNSV